MNRPASSVLAAAIALTLPAWSAAQSPSPWLQTDAIQQQLAAGQVVTQAALDARRARASIDAAVRIHAPAQTIWALLTQCKTAALLLPGLKRCRQLQTAPDGSWAVIEHDIKYSLLTPMVHSVFRADFQAPYRMDFHRVAGDLKDEVGSWILQPSADGQVTTVEYRVSVQAGFWLPRSMVRRSLRKQLPAALVALRAQAEQSTAPAAGVPWHRNGVSGAGAGRTATPSDAGTASGAGGAADTEGGTVGALSGTASDGPVAPDAVAGAVSGQATVGDETAGDGTRQ